MDKVRIDTICDLCFKIDDAEVETPATHDREIGVGKVWMRLTWCDPHDSKVNSMDEAIEMFSKYGEKVEDKRPARPKGLSPADNPVGAESTKRYDCPHCPRVFRRIDYYDRHVAKHRGTQPDELIKCDFPGCVATSTTVQGIGGHRTRAHGIKGKQGKTKQQKAIIDQQNQQILDDAWAAYNKAS